MSKKLAASAKVFFIAVIIGVMMFAIFAPLLTSLEIHCDLQANQSYTCQSKDTFLGLTFKEVNASQVNGIERDLTCKGSGPNRGCSAHAEFKTATGDLIALSRMYTNPDQVDKMVNTIKPLMATKFTPINMTFPPSTFVSVITISIGSCVVLLLLFVAILMLFGKDAKDIEAHAIDLRKKN